MFGIGGTELIVIAVVLLIAVGPNRLPTMLKAAVKGYREFRRATRELRASTGIDDLLQDEDLKDLRKPLRVPGANDLAKELGIAPAKAGPAMWAAKKSALGHGERTREAPPEGVDIAEIRDAMHRPSPEEAAKIIARKEAGLASKLAGGATESDDPIIAAKLAAAAAPVIDDEERDRIVAAKIAAAKDVPPPPDLDDEEGRRVVAAKIAAAKDVPPPDVDDEEGRRIVAAKIAAAAEDAPDQDDADEDPIIAAKIATARASAATVEDDDAP